jgi:hypothetical protein
MQTDTADPRRRVFMTVCWDNRVYCLLLRQDLVRARPAPQPQCSRCPTPFRFAFSFGLLLRCFAQSPQAAPTDRALQARHGPLHVKGDTSSALSVNFVIELH